MCSGMIVERELGKAGDVSAFLFAKNSLERLRVLLGETLGEIFLIRQTNREILIV